MDGVWELMRAGVHAMGDVVCVGRAGYVQLVWCMGVREAVGMFWGALGVARRGALAGEGRVWWCAVVMDVIAG